MEKQCRKMQIQRERYKGVERDGEKEREEKSGKGTERKGKTEKEIYTERHTENKQGKKNIETEREQTR